MYKNMFDCQIIIKKDCSILTDIEAEGILPGLNHSGLKQLVDQYENVVQSFPVEWTNEQIWFALAFANKAVENTLETVETRLSAIVAGSVDASP